MLAVVRAHVTALGGNALVSFYMTELILVDNPHKNQVMIKSTALMAGLIRFFFFSFFCRVSV